MVLTALLCIVVHFQAADQFPLTPCWENMAIMAHTLWLLFEIRESFFQQIILDAGVPKTFFSRIIVLAVFFSVNSIVVFLREITTKTLCLSIRTIDSQWDKTIYERQAFLCLCSFIYNILEIIPCGLGSRIRDMEAESYNWSHFLAND